ncbi:hypothetical protein [Aminobacter aminovorans]|uniref:hypothetical protein n=1 Tax=Aminobacter aminovorans TaxID=83263 RepID=UPI000E1FFF4D
MLLVQRIEQGWSVRRAAGSAEVSKRTYYCWLGRSGRRPCSARSQLSAAPLPASAGSHAGVADRAVAAPAHDRAGDCAVLGPGALDGGPCAAPAGAAPAGLARSPAPRCCATNGNDRAN